MDTLSEWHEKEQRIRDIGCGCLLLGGTTLAIGGSAAVAIWMGITPVIAVSVPITTAAIVTLGLFAAEAEKRMRI